MFARRLLAAWNVGRPTRRSAAPNRKRLRGEVLEDRRVMTNYLLLDWTPDYLEGEQVRGGFEEINTLRYADGTAPSFLDYDRDGWVTTQDASAIASVVANQTAWLLQGYNVQVIQNDWLNNTQWGVQWLNWGIQNPDDQVYVMYVGGSANKGHDNGGYLFGEAYQPPVGYVNEYYAYTYPVDIAAWMSTDRTATSNDYIAKVAQTVVHEFGHLLGAGHVWGNPQGDTNVMNYNVNSFQAEFPNAWYEYIELKNEAEQHYYGWQNPQQEVVNSLAFEPIWGRQGLRYGASPIDEHAQEFDWSQVPTHVASWTNLSDPVDVNADGVVSMADMLAVVSHLRTFGAGAELPSFDGLEDILHVDATNDGVAGLDDLLAVVQGLRDEMAGVREHHDLTNTQAADHFFASSPSFFFMPDDDEQGIV
jgi:hypothetical protein